MPVLVDGTQGVRVTIVQHCLQWQDVPLAHVGCMLHVMLTIPCFCRLKVRYSFAMPRQIHGVSTLRSQRRRQIGSVQQSSSQGGRYPGSGSCLTTMLPLTPRASSKRRISLHHSLTSDLQATLLRPEMLSQVSSARCSGCPVEAPWECLVFCNAAMAPLCSRCRMHLSRSRYEVDGHSLK